MRIFQNLDPKKGVADLVAQYNKIYPYSDMSISQALGSKLATDRNIQRFFCILLEIGERALSEDRRPQSSVNLVKELLDKEKISKMCCRSAILTTCDFYDSRAFYSNVL